ncbi:hypothetical protein BLNAU_13513 [Blattamonas nauphoetae]|uniref:Right handed beta helix domain-containing protein n=1 Tax=Blattamonas nauphoetae TaxID=2049346 RepID=A0ABQ9XML2_9EUKA|nr:hypothetical protein BLNAU_13513 [Blattamonas nauphoetae]
MLGCVVSLTSSHLSGSTIRDVNTVGCVLCSNSSFSSLLSSPNTDPNTDSDSSIILDGNSILPYKDGTPYSFDYRTAQSTSASFSHCRFTGANYESNVRPLTFDGYLGSISIESCSFETIAQTEMDGGAVYVYNQDLLFSPFFTATLSNFTNCCASGLGGAMYVYNTDDEIITSCRFEECSTQSGGGGLYLEGDMTDGHFPLVQMVDCVFADCTSENRGGGVYIEGLLCASVINSKFERCGDFTGFECQWGGGISCLTTTPLIVRRSQFIECKASDRGGAICRDYSVNTTISDTLVKDCYSGTTGAVYIENWALCNHYTFSHVLFVGNSVGEDSILYEPGVGDFGGDTTRFTDIAIIASTKDPRPTFKIDDCFTTVSSDSLGMIIEERIYELNYFFPYLHFDEEFNKIGPLLTAKPTTKVNEKTAKVELGMEGKTPLTSQEYEVTMKADGNETGTTLRMLFSDGTGTLVSIPVIVLAAEQAGIVFVPLSTDAILPVPLTLPPSTHSSPSRRDQSTPCGPSKAPKRATTAKHRPNQHCPQQVPTPTAPSRSSARRRYLRPHITSSSSSRRATQKARSTHTASLAVWERRAGRECCLTVLSLVIGRFVADHFNEKGVGL